MSLTKPSTGLSRPSLTTGASDLTPGANPTTQEKVAGTTTSDNITFNAPTGGSGAYTHALTLIKNPAAASGTLSGSTGLGPVTIGSMSNGDAYTVVCTSTDTTTGFTCRAVCSVHVAVPAVTFANPAIQPTTVVGAQSITFSAASGGTGSINYSGATLFKPAGSSATLSGSGLGPYTFTTDLNGAYEVTLTATDSIGISAIATGTVSLAITPSWHTVLDYDATAPASFGALAVGANVIGALTWDVLTTTGVPTIVHTQGTGIVVSVQTAVNGQTLAANVFSLMTNTNANPIRVTQVVNNITFSANAQGVPFGCGSNQETAAGSARCPFACGRLWRTASNDFRMRTVSNGTGTAIGGTNGITQSTGVTIDTNSVTSAVLSTYIYGQLAANNIQTNTTTVPAAAATPFETVFEPNSTYNRMSFFSAIADRGTAIDCWPALYIGPHLTGSGGAYSYNIIRMLVEEYY